MKLLSSISVLSLTSLILLTGCNSLAGEKNNVDGELNEEKVSTEEDFKKQAEKDLIGQWICSKPTIAFEFREDGKFLQREGYIESKVGTYEIVSATKDEIKVEQTFGNEMKTYYITISPDKTSFKLKFSSKSEYPFTFNKSNDENEFDELLDMKRESLEESTNSSDELGDVYTIENSTESVETSNTVASDIKIEKNNEISTEEIKETNSSESMKENQEVIVDSSEDNNNVEVSDYPVGDERIVERYRYMTPEERKAMIQAEEDIMNAGQDYIDSVTNEDYNAYQYDIISPDEEGYATDNPNFKSNE